MSNPKNPTGMLGVKTGVKLPPVLRPVSTGGVMNGGSGETP